MSKRLRNLQILILPAFLALMIWPSTASAQKMNEVLEADQDHIIKGREKLLLKVNGDKLVYDLWYDDKTKFIPLKDSSLFLSKQSAVVVYIKPVNPLNYSFESSIQFTPNPIYEEGRIALESIGSALAGFVTQNNKDVQNVDEKAKVAKAKIGSKKGTATDKAIVEEQTTIAECNKIINKLVEIVEAAERLLKKDQKTEVADIFGKLKLMSFEREQETKDEIDKITILLEPLATDLGDIKTKIEDLENEVSKYQCESPHPFIVKVIFSDIANKMKLALKERTNRYNNLNKCLELVKKAYYKASASDEGLRWIVAFENKNNDNTIEIKKGTTSNYQIIINEAGYQLSEEKEIIVREKKAKINTLIRVIKFQRFITEVTPGIAYTFLEFPKYSVSTDGSGKQTVVDAGAENFKRMAFSAMANFNYFIPDADNWNPFLQIGIGSNTDYPAFFTGGGFRFNLGSGAVKALSISGGLVSTWIKQLNKLKPGQEVSGSAELEKDLTHEFRWPPKPYIGIQLKL